MRSRTAAACLLLGALFCLALAPAAGAKVSVTFSKRVLDVEGGSKSERIFVVCDANDTVKMNGRNPRGGPVACSRVAEVDVSAGAGDDRVDLSGVDARFGEAKFSGFGTGTGVAVVGDFGSDRLIGSRTAFNLFLGGAGNDRAGGGRRRDILSGGDGDDDLSAFAGRDTVLGKAGDDRLRGGNGRDLVSGNAGDDAGYGEEGSDLLGGGAGRDKLRGGPGADEIHGGPGRDSIKGGPGNDTIVQDPPRRRR